MGKVISPKTDLPHMATIHKPLFLPTPLLRLLSTSGEKIESSRFGKIFHNCAPSPSVGSTITDRDGIKWTVESQDIKEEALSNERKAIVYTYVLGCKDPNLWL